jgi:DNA-directed RNA polymerase sigma subunit (sigma70/sigma32)
MSKELGRTPTKKELGDAVGMSEMQVDRCCAAMAQRCFSLDSPLTNHNKPTEAKSEKDTLVGLISCNTDDSDYNKLKHMFMREDLLETLNRHLSKEEVRLLMLRYGLEDSIVLTKKNGTLTIAEISQEMGMKPDKVRRIINKSLKQLQACIGDEWRDFEREYEA